MVPTKTWLAIPALALAAVVLAVAARQSTESAVALGALGAAIAAAVRAFAGPSLAVVVAAAAASLLGVLAVLESSPLDVTRSALACAAGMFAIAELARPLPPGASPWPAIGGAALAALLDPSLVALLPVSGVRLVTGPWSLPRWAFAVPAFGVLVVVCAVLAAALRDGVFAGLWTTWAARPALAADPAAVLLAAGELLGPITAVVAAAGLGACAVRGRIAASAALGTAGGALALDVAAGSAGPATMACAALGAGIGIARFAALVRWPTGQAFVGAAVGVMLVVAPAWTLVTR